VMSKRIRTDQGDILALYNVDAKKHPLLSADQEVELGRRIEAGDQEARNRFVEANLRLVLYVAKEYANATRSLAFDDLVQEGTIGLMKAVKGWDYRRGFRFSTYAVDWIRREIQNAIADKDQMIRVPIHLSELVRKYKKVDQEQWKALGAKAGFNAIVLRMGLAPGEVARLKAALRIEWLTFPDLAETLGHQGEEMGPQWDCIADPDSSTPEEIVVEGSFAVALQTALMGLPKRERKALTMRLNRATLEQIGDQLGFVSGERARQLVVRAIKAVAKSLKEVSKE
jgi:RNA polymerase primary sigma factor